MGNSCASNAVGTESSLLLVTWKYNQCTEDRMYSGIQGIDSAFGVYIRGRSRLS